MTIHIHNYICTIHTINAHREFHIIVFDLRSIYSELAENKFVAKNVSSWIFYIVSTIFVAWVTYEDTLYITPKILFKIELTVISKKSLQNGHVYLIRKKCLSKLSLFRFKKKNWWLPNLKAFNLKYITMLFILNWLIKYWILAISNKACYI